MTSRNNSDARTKAARTRKRNAAHRLAIRRQRPLGRLSADGSCSAENTRRRLQWLVNEWQLPDELPKIRVYPTEELLDFAEKYYVNLEWLLCGDLKGLWRMMRAHKLARGVPGQQHNEPPPEIA